MSGSAVVRPGLLDRLKKNAGIVDDEAFARLIGSSRSTLIRVRNGGEPSMGFVTGVARAFGLGLGEVAVISDGNEESTDTQGAAA
jgi:putative transcriptional regulator